MKLSELRDRARLGERMFPDPGLFKKDEVKELRELEADIDQAIENAKHIAYADGVRASVCTEQHASGWDYRKAVRTGWNRAIDRMHEIFPVYGHMLDEMRQANDVPEMNPGERKMAEGRAERMSEDAFRSGAVRVDARGEQEALKSWTVLTAHENELAKLRPVLEQMRERIDYLEKQERNTLEVFEEQRGMIRGLSEQIKSGAASSSVNYHLDALEQFRARVGKALTST